MADSSQTMDDIQAWKASVNEIAEAFEIPQTTASSWERNIGDLELIEQTLGKSGPENYLDLIQRREWIPIEMEQVESKWVLPVKKWCVEKADEVYLVEDSEERESYKKEGRSGVRSWTLGSGLNVVEYISDSAKEREPADEFGINWSDEMQRLRDEMDRKEGQLKYEMKRFDCDWIALARELREVEKSLITIYNSHLEEKDEKFQYKKDKIIELKEAFPYLRANNDLVAEAVDGSVSYARQFKGTPGGNITNRNVTTSLRKEVFDRDDDSCVSCRSEDDVIIHHIIPHDQGGESELENLATLCEECHYYAHGGGQQTDEGYHTAAKWDSVEYSDKQEFWDDWVDRDFDDRPPKSHTRVDPDIE